MATPQEGWRDFIAGLAPVREDGLPRFHQAGAGATKEALGRLRFAVSLALPAGLRGLPAEMNGIYDAPAYLYLVMSVGAIIQQNDRAWKSEYAARDAVTIPFDRLFIFAARGNGDLFGFPIENNRVRDDRVFDRDHELEEVTPFSSSRRDFLARWATTTTSW